MKTLNSLQALDDWKKAQSGKTVALVPTMGALHAGHISLVERGLEQADICLPYIFLNPAQFAQGEDLDQYPKTLDSDLEKLKEAGAHAVWIPREEDIYPKGIEISVKAGLLAKPLEGEHRPHFFDGVTTVLHKMFSLSKPDFVMMGEKDFQQLQVVKEMVRDHDIETRIIGVETIRDENGLALSSRNAYLSKDEYAIAIQLNQILEKFAKGVIDEDQTHQMILEAGFDKIDYCTKRNAENLDARQPLNRVLAAVWLGSTRLIDNMAICV